MSCVDEAEKEETEASIAGSQDVGLVSWDRMDVLMASYEYGGSRVW